MFKHVLESECGKGIFGVCGVPERGFPELRSETCFFQRLRTAVVGRFNSPAEALQRGEQLVLPEDFCVLLGADAVAELGLLF